MNEETRFFAGNWFSLLLLTIAVCLGASAILVKQRRQNWSLAILLPAAALLLGIGGGLEIQVLGHVAAVKAALAMFPAQHREEQALLRVAEGVECAFALAFVRDRVAGTFQDALTGPGILDHGQRVQVMTCGLV